MKTFKDNFLYHGSINYYQDSDKLYTTVLSKYAPIELLLDMKRQEGNNYKYVYSKYKKKYYRKGFVSHLNHYLLHEQHPQKIVLPDKSKIEVSFHSIEEESGKVILKLAVKSSVMSKIINPKDYPESQFVLFLSKDIHNDKYKKVLKNIQDCYLKQLLYFNIKIITTSSDKIENLLYPPQGKFMEEDKLLENKNLLKELIFKSVEEPPF